MDYAEGKGAYYVDFSSRKPIPGKDYYLVVAGYNFTLDVMTSKRKLDSQLIDYD